VDRDGDRPTGASCVSARCPAHAVVGVDNEDSTKKPPESPRSW
jgi:hypothetical protein